MLVGSLDILKLAHHPILFQHFKNEEQESPLLRFVFYSLPVNISS